MKKLVILTALIGCLWATVPAAEAGHRRYRDYDCDDRSYRRSYYRTYYNNDYNYYRSPARYVRYYDDGCYRPRYVRRSPRVSFAFGF